MTNTRAANEALNPQISGLEVQVKPLSELDGIELDLVVAQVIGKDVEYEQVSGTLWYQRDNIWSMWHPSTAWNQCGPLVAAYQIMLCPEAHLGHEGTEDSELWYADVYYDSGEQFTTGMCDTPLIAACRAIVGMKFGDLKGIEIPRQLIGACNE